MAKTLSLVLGVVFILVGLLGLWGTAIVGSEGFFQTDMLHDWIHMLIGIAGVVMALYGEAMSVMFLKVFGGIYLAVAVLGFVAVKNGKILGLLTTNDADNWLHVVLALVMLGAGFVFSPKKEIAMPAGN